MWEHPSIAEARERYDALALEVCTAEDRLAFRTAPDEPWRLIVPDEAGAGAGISEGRTCAEALAVGSAAEWRRDRSANPALCTHLYRRGATGDAIRCLLREPPRNGTGKASRQDLPRAPDDPAFDQRLLEVLAPGAPGDRSGFAPYRVRDLLAEVADRAAVDALARSTPVDTPWQAVLAGAHVPLEQVDAWLAASDSASAASAEIALASSSDTGEAIRSRMERAAAASATDSCAPPHQPEPGRCADLAGLAREWLRRHPPQEQR
jgi:hypothetical protein